MSSGWLSRNRYLIRMSYDNVIMSSGWHRLPFVSHPDEIVNFDFPHHAVVLQRFRKYEIHCNSKRCVVLCWYYPFNSQHFSYVDIAPDWRPLGPLSELLAIKNFLLRCKWKDACQGPRQPQRATLKWRGSAAYSNYKSSSYCILNEFVELHEPALLSMVWWRN